MADVAAGEEHAPALVDHPCRDRRVRHVRPVGEQAEDEEAAEHDEHDGLEKDPHKTTRSTAWIRTLPDQKLTPPGTLHSRHSSVLLKWTSLAGDDHKSKAESALATAGLEARLCRG